MRFFCQHACMIGQDVDLPAGSFDIDCTLAC